MKKHNLKSFIFFGKHTLVFLLVVVGFVLARNYVFKKNNIEASSIQYIKIAGQKIKVDLALTPKEQEQGLSGRAGLNENAGMLFVFKNPSRNFFWMKDMNFPIDMVWVSEDLHVIYIEKDAKPESYPEAFGPNKNTKYVLEAVSGFSDKNNLKEEDSVELLPS